MMFRVERPIRQAFRLATGPYTIRRFPAGPRVVTVAVTLIQAKDTSLDRNASKNLPNLPAIRDLPLLASIQISTS
jgi:hypothetical protein